LKKLDFIIIIMFLAAAGIFYFTGFRPKGEGSVAVVYIAEKEKVRLPLNDDTEKTFTTDYGTNTVVIKNGKASIASADCRDKICVNHNAISKNGESIICLPHKLVVEIEGTEKSEVDAVAK